MTEQQIRDRIKELESELRRLKAKLPKKEPKVRERVEATGSEGFMRMANKIVNSKRIEYTDCRFCGEKSELIGASYICPKCGPHSLFETVRTK
jgi:rubrerythrin